MKNTDLLFAECEKLLRWCNESGRDVVREASLRALDEVPIRTPAEALFERLLLAAVLASHALGRGGQVMWAGGDKPEWSAFASVALMEAAIYVWTADMRRAAVPGRTLGELESLVVDTEARVDLPNQVCWFTWDTFIDTENTIVAKAVPGALAVGMLFVQTAPGAATVVDFYQDPEGNLRLGSGEVPKVVGRVVARRGDGMVATDDYYYANTAAMLAFLDSPYVPRERRPMDRASRRRVATAEAEWTDQEVTFLMLRRPEHAQSVPHDGTHDVDWNWRWIVSGHFRRHWFPSEQRHKVIWIPPHVKGPEGLPLKPRVFKVAR